MDKGLEQIELINELNCKDLLIRIPLWDIKNIEKYKEFVTSFKNRNITLNILQDKENINDSDLLQKNITTIFSTFKGICSNYQIGNATNETKWGFTSINEYLNFYTVVQTVRDQHFREYKLLGCCMKGFDLQNIASSLFNKVRFKFDKIASILDTPKEGFPENPQKITFDLIKQINTISAISSLSIKANNEVIISQANWHIKGQKSANEFAVSEETYTKYMVRYYLLALGTKKVQTVFWFQLISNTFGLTYLKEGKIVKRKSFDAYKTMIKFLENCKVEKYTNSGGLHVLTVTNQNNKKLDIVWVEAEGSVELTEFNKVFDIYGNEMKENIKITDSPIYAYH